MDVIARRPTFHSAFLLSVEVSELEDKQIYGDLDIDAGQWSRIRGGKAHFPMNKLTEFMDLVGNEICLQWLSFKRGYGLTPLRTSLERQVEELQQKLEERDRDMAAIKRFVRETRQ